MIETSNKTELQRETFDNLSRWLHLRRATVSNLVVRARNPLPLPLRRESSPKLELNENYRLSLQQWLKRERNLQAKNRLTESLLVRLDERLVQTATSSHTQLRWQIHETTESFPPGHFLG